MPILIDPATGQRIIYMKHIGDISYELSNGSATAVQDKEKIPTRETQMWAGHGNQLQGTRAQIEDNAHIDELSHTATNKRKATHDQVVIKRYIKLD